MTRVKIRSEVDEWSGRLWRAELPTGYARWFAHFEGALRWAERMMRIAGGDAK